MQKFNPTKHLKELVRLDEYLSLNPDCPVLWSRRKFSYLVYEAKDRSFVTCEAAINLGQRWFVWPQGIANYVEQKIDQTQRARKYAA
jgi:hypothetical protein